MYDMNEPRKRSRPQTSIFSIYLMQEETQVLCAKQRSFNVLLWMETIVGIISENQNVYIAKQRWKS